MEVEVGMKVVGVAKLTVFRMYVKSVRSLWV